MKLPKQCPKCKLRRFRETNKKIICEYCGWSMWKNPHQKAKELITPPSDSGAFSKDENTPNVFPKGAIHQKEMIRNKPELPRDEYQEWEKEDDFLNVKLPKEGGKNGTAREWAGSISHKRGDWIETEQNWHNGKRDWKTKDRDEDSQQKDKQYLSYDGEEEMIPRWWSKIHYFIYNGELVKIILEPVYIEKCQSSKQ